MLLELRLVLLLTSYVAIHVKILLHLLTILFQQLTVQGLLAYFRGSLLTLREVRFFQMMEQMQLTVGILAMVILLLDKTFLIHI